MWHGLSPLCLSQPSPACRVSWNTCRRTTSTGRAWTRWSVRVCVLLLLDRLLVASVALSGAGQTVRPSLEHWSLFSGDSTELCGRPGDSGLGRYGQSGHHWLTDAETRFHLKSQPLFWSGAGVESEENRLSFEGPSTLCCHFLRPC